MSWFQEMAVRAAAQDNPKLMPTPEACELFMGFPKGWTDLGSGGAEAGAYVKILRGVQGIPDCKQRLKAMGKAVVPLIPMFLGWFIQHHESQAAAMRDSSMLSGGTFPACVISNAGIQEFKEVGMNDDSPASGVGHSQSSECSMQAGTEGEAPALVSASRETLEGDSVPQPSNAALNNPDPTGMSAGVDSKSTEPQGNKNWGIDVIADAVAYLRSYLSFPDDRYFLPLALFAALEHCWDECFDEVPYLSVGAAVKSAGKTRVLELLTFLAGEERAILMDGSITEAALYTEIAQGKTILIDESERLRTPRSPLRPILNGGYRRGQYVYRKAGGHNVKFSTYCPKVFSHLGDVYDSLRDRCLLVQMQRTMGGNRKEYCRAVAQQEGSAISVRLHEALARTAR